VFLTNIPRGISPDTEKAIWNTNAFFAYIITVKLFNMKWEPRRLSAVFLATAGVLAVVYGGTTAKGGNSGPEASVAPPSIKPSAPVVGDLLTLVASITYGLYQVLYKKYAALPSDPSELIYHEVPSEETAIGSPIETSRNDSIAPLPFGLYANLLTSVIGLLTLAIVWIFIPICHYLDVEPFMLPANLTICLAIAGIALGGVVFNAGFMASIFPFLDMPLLIRCIV
jgi:drug/metabolite transporter (DMT)-like permease